jgi:hypothetical protein
MLPRLLLVVGLSVAVMLPLIWAAFAPVPDLREVSKTDADPVHNGSAGADWRRVSTPEAMEPSNSTERSDETTIGTAPEREREASATRSDDLPGAGHSEPAAIKPSLPRAFDKNAAPEPLVTEEAKRLPEEAKPLPKEAKPLPEEAKPLQKEAKRPPEKAKPPPEEATAPTVSEREASATRSDDLPGAGHSEPTEIKPSPPRAFDKNAAPEPLVTEEAKPLPEEAKTLPEAKPQLEAKPLPEESEPLQKEAKRLPEKAEPSAAEATTPAVNVEKPPEVKQGNSAPVATHNGRARARAHGTERQKTHRKKQRDHSGWVGIMREAGWLAPGQRR